MPDHPNPLPLLPLPEPHVTLQIRNGRPVLGVYMNLPMTPLYTAEQLQAYAAPLAAEVERLRGEVAELNERLEAAYNSCSILTESVAASDKVQERCEALAGRWNDAEAARAISPLGAGTVYAARQQCAAELLAALREEEG